MTFRQRNSVAMAVLVATGLAIGIVAATGSDPKHASPAAVVVPDRLLTPGATFPHVTTAQVCVPGYSTRVRRVSLRVRRAAFAGYRLDYTLRSGYELDHLISLELGGSNALANLWPEPLEGAGGAKAKDRLENRLHALVCSGQLGLAQAQQAIAGDWGAAYAEYVGAP